MAEARAYLIERLRERFATDPRLGELGLEVRLVGDIAHVRGQVESEARRQAVVTVITEVAPDLAVRNEVEITDLSPTGGGVERLS
ncbi:MAG: BON domain-containing protein [Actinomycetota bacterium]|nr:BON domain-containing protein [Actinomycetota bacterium]